MESDLTVTSIQQAIQAATGNVLATIISFIPLLFAALFLLIIGSIIAGWAKWLTIKLFHTFGINKLTSDSPLEKFFEKAEISGKFEHILGDIIRWLILLVFFIAALNLLGLTTVSLFLTSILGYLPHVIAAALILMIGTLVAGLIESLIKSSLTHINRSTARLVSKIASYIVMVFTVLAAIAQLGIAQHFINTLFTGFVATLALALGLAFGLGSKDLVAKILDEWYEKLKADLK